MLTKERQVSFFPEKSPENRGIEVRDNLGIETTAGLVDIRVNTYLLEEDILASVERESPQFRDKAIELIGRLRLYFGKRPLAEVVTEELTTRKGVPEEKGKILKVCFQILDLISLGSTTGGFYANEKMPFFYFNTPEIVKEFGKRGFNKELGEHWFHERQHFIDFLDPVRRAKFIQDQKEEFSLFAGIDGAFGFLWFAAMAKAIYDEDKPKITRRTFLKAALGGMGTGALMTAAFSPVAMTISRQFTYLRGHEGEKAARHEAEEGILIAPFEEIFQIEFRQTQ